MPFIRPINCGSNFKLSFIQRAQTFVLIPAASSKQQLDTLGLRVQSVNPKIEA
jgi:hypothetical protein